MTSDGTVLGRMFCKMSSEKAQLNQLLKRIKDKDKQSADKGSTGCNKTAKAPKATKADKDAKYEGSKRYNCDLSASYNIAARYFVRGILKTLGSKIRQDIQAKVPGLKFLGVLTEVRAA